MPAGRELVIGPARLVLREDQSSILAARPAEAFEIDLSRLRVVPLRWQYVQQVGATRLIFALGPGRLQIAAAGLLQRLAVLQDLLMLQVHMVMSVHHDGSILLRCRPGSELPARQLIFERDVGLAD